MSGRKKRMKTEAVKYLYCPQYEGLSLDKIFELIENNKSDLLNYLPDKRDRPKLPRQYCLNLIYSLEGENFYNFV